MVRNSDKGAKVASQYPKIKLVYGDLDSTDVLTAESANADIVVHTANCDHVASANAIVAGFGQKAEGKKGWLIHTSGTGILCWSDYERKSYGVKNDKVYDDWEGIKEVTSLPDYAIHRNVDKIILAASEKHPGKVDTAIVCPPCISGPGRGPDNQKSVQVYRMAKAALQRGKGFQVEGGKNLWTQVHVQDLSDVYLALVTEALSGQGQATWNAEGYYFAEAGDIVWGDIGRAIAKAAKENNLIETDEIDSISTQEADKLTGSGSYLWGMNSRARAIRAGKLLGWKPRHPSLVDLIPSIVAGEAKELGLAKGYAEVAAG